MSPPTFARLSTDLFYFLDEDAIASMPYCIAFSPVDPLTLTSLTLGQTWGDHPGVYLFLNIAHDQLHQASFAHALSQLLTQNLALQQTRFLWIENPNNALSKWRFNALVLEQNRNYAVKNPIFFDLRNYSLFMAGGSQVSLNSESNGFVFTKGSSQFAGFHLTTGFGERSLRQIETITLPFHGVTAGCFQFDLTLAKPQNQGESYADLTSLDISLKLFCRDLDLPANDTDFAVKSYRFPLFQEDAGTVERYDDAGLTLYATLDLLNPLSEIRSYFEFTNPDTIEAPKLPSCYRTNTGYPIYLTPDQNCRLVFAEIPPSSLPDVEQDFYLVPSGDFKLNVFTLSGEPATNINTFNLLCGISGVEYIKFSTQHSSRISFQTQQAAFALKFVANESLKTGDATEATLTALAKTSWAYIKQDNERPAYYAQPEQAVLYKPTDGFSMLQYLEVRGTELPDITTELPAFPLFPYGGVQGTSLAEYEQLEQQLLNPKRRLEINRLSAAAIRNAVNNGTDNTSVRTMVFDTSTVAASIDTVVGTTPQGLLATFSESFESIQQLTLAKDTDDNLVQLTNIERQSELWSALQSNQLFLVISQPEALQTYFEQNNRLTIQKWTFNLDPANWRSDTVVIFKYFGKPLIDLLENTSAWSHSDTFVGDAKAIASTREQLLQLFRDAINKDVDGVPQKERENYKNFARIARNELWSGIVILNVSIPPSNMPPELEALSAGINKERFYAHHVGIETTPIVSNGTTLETKQSSLFGLIDYQDDAIPVVTDTGYNFQVNRLNVLFQNSQIKAFSSEITITLDKLFEERTQLFNSNTGRNLIVLKGTAENHDGKTTYVFSFSGNNQFNLPDSQIFNHINIIKAQFTTTTDRSADPTAPNANAAIAGRFSFWGQIDFKSLEKFDILSFGAEVPISGSTTTEENTKFLSFSNLVVTMNFRRNKPEERTFTFEPANLAFDLKQNKSQPRSNSLYAKFPLSLSGFFASDGSKNPGGYLAVKTPLGKGSLEGSPLYGLIFELDLGSLGALSGVTKFVSSLLVAWSPGSDSGSKVFVGLKMPGLSGDVLGFSLQNVIKLTFNSVEFAVSTTQKEHESPKSSYLLKMKNIVLKVLMLSFPRSSQTELIIFGDPNGSPENRTIGWYAAYAKSPSPPAATK